MTERLHITRLRIETLTEEGLYGVDISLDVGLNIVHADNTLGKSTCLQAVLYGLGLEGALGPSRNVPLKSALTKKLRRADGAEVNVLGSDVYLELMNSQGKHIVVRRSAEPSKKDLVSVWDNRQLRDGIGDEDPTDYFVRFEGAYVRERGFHHYLSEFVDIEVPDVPKYDGTYCPLYLEAIISVNYVEQTRGWGGIQNVLPTYLGIEHVAQRVIEFTLALDIQKIRREREESEIVLKRLQEQWADYVDQFRQLAHSLSGTVELPRTLGKDVDCDNLPDILIYEDDSGLPIAQARQEIQGALDDVRERQVPTVDETLDDLTGALEVKTAELNELEHAVNRLAEDLETSEQYIRSIRTRKDGLTDSLRKYKDVRRLMQIGSKEQFQFLQRVCPTCGQSIDDSLLPHVHDHQVLGVDDNIDYLEKQVRILDTLLMGEEKTQKDKTRYLSKGREELRELRSSIRAIKDSLMSASNAPSKEIVRQEVSLEAKLEKLSAAEESAMEIKEELMKIGHQWKETHDHLGRLPTNDLTATDLDKLHRLEECFKRLLARFDYKSTRIDAFEISKRTYKPAIENVELGSEASASDNIRMIWAYLYSLMIVTRDAHFDSNHLGFLILDEPRQQEARDVSFREFVSEAASSTEYDQQVIVATSEKLDELQSAVETGDVKLIHFDTEIISPLEPLGSR